MAGSEYLQHYEFQLSDEEIIEYVFLFIKNNVKRNI